MDIKPTEPYRNLRLLHKTASLFLESETLDDTIGTLPGMIADHYAVPIVAIELYDADRQEMVFAGAAGIPKAEGGRLRVPVDQTISGTVATSGRAVFDLDVSEHADYRAEALRELGVMMFACVPLTGQEGVIGTLAIADSEERADILDGADLLQALADSLAQEIERHRQAEHLREGEAKYRHLYETMTQGVVLQDAEGKIVEANRAASDILGLTRDQLFGRTAYDPRWKLIREDGSPYDPSEMPSNLALRTGKPVKDATCGIYVPEKDEYRWIIIGSAPQFRGSETEPSLTMTVFTDITERKRAETALRESEERFRTIIDAIGAIGEGLFIVDVDYRVRYMNQVMIDGFGDQTGKICYQSVGGLEGECEYCRLKQVIDEGETVHYQPTTADGRTFDIIAVPIKNNDGTISKMEVIRDITEQKRAEEDLWQGRERLAGIIRGTNVGTWEWNVQTGETIFNERWAEIIGYTLDELSPCSIDTWRKFAHPDDLKTSDGLLQKHFAGELDYYVFEARMRHKSGEWVWVLDQGRVSRWTDDGQPLMMMGTHQDITERKRAEVEKEKLESQLLQAQKMEAVGRLAGGVAHDFNNMLGVILGHAEMILEEKTPDQPFYTNLEEIKAAAQRSADLTRQLLAFARKQTVAPKVLDINKTVGSMTRMLRRLIGEDIDLAWLPGEHVWPVRIDPAQIDQILANLCVNARDAIAGVGKVTIETDNVSLDEAYCADYAGFVPGEYVMLAVSDNGCGMDAEHLDNIFEPFFTTKEQDKGTGLGLATVYGVVKQNNGFINVYSEPGQGTTFKIYLPRHTAKAAETEKRKPRAAARGRETILLVEDEPAILHMTTMMLERQGYTVVGVGTPGEAIRLAREHTGKIDLLMTDVVMPEMNGRDLAKNILSLYPGIRSLFMSGYTADVIAHHGVLDEGVNFIQKPFLKGDLAAKVREVLERK